MTRLTQKIVKLKLKQHEQQGKTERRKQNPDKWENVQQKNSRKTEKIKTPEVEKRHRTGRQIKGTDNAQISLTSTTADSGFSAPERKIWLHISRCKSDTTIDQVKNHQHKKWPQLTFEIEKLQSKSSNSSFKVSTQYAKELLTLFYTPSNWPEGVVIKQLRFFRRNNTGQF
jgi:neutral trehalase